MGKKSEGVLKTESLSIALGVEGVDPGTAVNGLLAGEEADVVARIAATGFPNDGLTAEALADRILAFLDLAARSEAGDKNRPAVLDAITARGISVLEPEAPLTRPAQPPEGGAAPLPDGGKPAQPPEQAPAPEPPLTRSQVEPDADGLVELTVLREDGLQGAAGVFIAFGQQGKFPAEEAYMHLAARNARLPSADD